MDIKQKARQLREHSTDAEKLLWHHLRNRRLNGWKFRRQFPVGKYIVDFVCQELKLIIEIDGGQHADQITYDLERTRILNSKRYQVVRYWNNEVLGNTTSVLESLTLTLARRRTAQRERELEYTPSPSGRGHMSMDGQ